jgi:hypothetical protein
VHLYLFVGPVAIGIIAVLVFPLICAAQAWRWGFPIWSGLLTGFLWGPFGILMMWAANERQPA